jgi:snurportin-1
LDIFADLTLGHSDEEDDGDDGDGTADPTEFTPGSVVPYASMVEPYQPPNAISGTLKQNEAVANSTTKGVNRKRKKKKGKKKPSKYADKCMYAELLEMSEDNPWSNVDGLPENLETAWVAVGPVPVGKRCLAVTQQSSGIAGVGKYNSSTIFYAQSYRVSLSSEHNITFKATRQDPDTPFSFKSPSLNGIGLHTRRKLA